MKTFEPFDSGLFGIRVFRSNSLDDEDLSDCDLLVVVSERELEEEKVKRYGAMLIDIKEVYERRFSGPEAFEVKASEGETFSPISACPLRDEKDRERLLQICLESGINSRYYRDPRMPREWYQKLYSTWLQNSLNGSVAYDIMLARLFGEIVGFVTLEQKGPDTTSLALVGVAEGLRGRGIGSKMLAATLDYVVNKVGHRVVTVSTHGHNPALGRFYSRQGFRLAYRRFVYHVWSNSRE